MSGAYRQLQAEDAEKGERLMSSNGHSNIRVEDEEESKEQS